MVEYARSYFGSANVLLNIGLNKPMRGKSANSFVNRMKNGCHDDGDVFSVSPETFRLIEIYALLYDQGKRYDERTFKRPVIS